MKVLKHFWTKTIQYLPKTLVGLPSIALKHNQPQHIIYNRSNACIIELLPKIDLTTSLKVNTTSSTESDDYTTTAGVKDKKTDFNIIDSSAILQLSTFKRKKPKMRKDRNRTIRRRIKRKSQKKRAKYNL